MVVGRRGTGNRGRDRRRAGLGVTAKNPQRPDRPLTLALGDICQHVGPLWRIHRVNGTHRMAWNGLRDFGPLQQFRWEPHPLPRGHHPGVGISYTAIDPTTAFAEVFQGRRAVTLTDQYVLTAWMPSRSLELLDLTANHWALHHGASASLPAAPKSTCRNWAERIHAEWGSRIDGLHVPSTLTGNPVVVLFARAATAFPAAPSLSRPLTHVSVEQMALKAADTLRWPLR
ncbi:RES family NAD+ phosphorylase [Arthrobacter rhombi]|uniref:RES family NAD+ phosphorylase n=1 Tax=Arthrobacter rhombi TaxID=71253 RepID=UPI003F8EEA63